MNCMNINLIIQICFLNFKYDLDMIKTTLKMKIKYNSNFTFFTYDIYR